MNELSGRLAISRQKSPTIERKDRHAIVRRVLRRGEYASAPQRNSEFCYSLLQRMQSALTKSGMTKSANLASEGRVNG